MDAKGASYVAVLRLEQALVILVLYLHLLHVGLGAAAHRALYIQHLEQPRPLRENVPYLGLAAAKKASARLVIWNVKYEAYVPRWGQ
jgi:hypothetical protein